MAINPTRMNLINTRKTIKVAGKGHDLLKRKREVLVAEFLGILSESRNDRIFLKTLLDQGYKSAAVASTYVGDFELDRAAEGIEERRPIKITQKNVMGVKIPEISTAEEKMAFGASYSLLSTSAAVDDVRDSFEKVSGLVIEMARKEQGLKRLVLEIDKTKRRVNALEYVTIPRLASQAKYINMRLDEIDRDTFSALKHVKKRLARKE